MSEEHRRGPDVVRFKALVRTRWIVSLVLTAVMLAVYYGFILILAFDKDLLTAKVGENMTLGIPVGLFVIVFSFLITGVYVFWANTSHDRAVREIIQDMREKRS